MKIRPILQSVFFLLPLFFGCGEKKEPIEYKLSKKPNEQFYKFKWHWDITNIPLLSPYKLNIHKGYEHGGIISEPAEEKSTTPILVPQVINLNIENKFIFGETKPYKFFEKNVPKYWFIMDPKTELIHFYENKNDFVNHLENNGINNFMGLSVPELKKLYYDKKHISWYPQ